MSPNDPTTPLTPSDVAGLPRASQGQWALDSANSKAEFHVKHFWGLITVHGQFERQEGEGIVEADGTASGAIRIEATSLNTKNKKRDKHLRSDEFFDAEHHPTVTVTVSRLDIGDNGTLAAEVQLDAAGHTQAIHPLIKVAAADTESVTLRGEATVDRSEFGMTWSPLGMAARQARVVITARFVRA